MKGGQKPNPKNHLRSFWSTTHGTVKSVPLAPKGEMREIAALLGDLGYGLKNYT